MSVVFVAIVFKLEVVVVGGGLDGRWLFLGGFIGFFALTIIRLLLLFQYRLILSRQCFMLKKLRFEAIQVKFVLILEVQFHTTCPFTMDRDPSGGVFLSVGARREEHSEDANHYNVRNWVRFVCVSLVKLFNPTLRVKIIPRNLFKFFVINIIIKVPQVAVEFLMLWLLLFLSEQISKVNVENHDDFSDWHKCGIKTEFDGQKTCLFDQEVIFDKVCDHRGVMVVIQAKVKEYVAGHSEFQLKNKVRVVHPLALHFAHFDDFGVKKYAYRFQRIKLV